MILAALSSAEFEGEFERVAAFAAALPDYRVETVQGGMGKLLATEKLVEDRLKSLENVIAVYSVGGANAAILSAFEKRQRKRPAMIGHDLGRDNQWLLNSRHLDFVIHHDLRQDARSASQYILKAHRLLPRDFDIPASTIQIAPPFNM